MWSRLKRAVKRVFSGGSDSIPAPVIVKPSPEIVIDKPIVEVVESPVPETGAMTRSIQLDRWTKACLDIVQGWEGETPYANITGDFDGMGLTCGSLGWTWHYGDQQRLVKEFAGKVGTAVIFECMPTFGKQYWNLVNGSIEGTIGSIRKISRGANVSNPYKKELEALWTHPEFIKVQVSEAKRTMAKFAMDNILSFGNKVTFQKFLWLFDTRVLNGSLKGIDLSLYKNAEAEIAVEAINNMAVLHGYNTADAKKNKQLWAKLNVFQGDEPQLLMLAMKRAKLSRKEFIHTTLNRRGTISTGAGYVNGKLWYPFEQCGIAHDSVLADS